MAGTKPKFGSALDGYWGSDNSVHVNFIGADDHVRRRPREAEAGYYQPLVFERLSDKQGPRIIH
jgi:hypothetical protein